MVKVLIVNVNLIKFYEVLEAMKFYYLILAMVIGIVLSAQCFADDRLPKDKFDDPKYLKSKIKKEGDMRNEKGKPGPHTPDIKKTDRDRKNVDKASPNAPRSEKLAPRHDKNGKPAGYTKKDKHGRIIHYDAQGRVIDKPDKP
jgi:hypothetical protein